MDTWHVVQSAWNRLSKATGSPPKTKQLGYRMSAQFNRRQALKAMGTVSAAALLPTKLIANSPGIQIAGHDAEIQLSSISACTLRLTIVPITAGQLASVPQDGSLVQADWGAPVARLRDHTAVRTIQCGDFNVTIASDPLKFTITNSENQVIQRLSVDRATGSLT